MAAKPGIVMTRVLYVLVKLRVQEFGGLVGDVATISAVDACSTGALSLQDMRRAQFLRLEPELLVRTITF
jgi:hypothetical protein